MRPTLAARILGTSDVPVGPLRTTEELAARALPARDPKDLLRKTGIATRRWLAEGETVASLGARALREALASAGMVPEDLRRVVLVTSAGGDVLIPANANAVCEALGLAHTCDGFDLNNACMGFLSALDVAARSVHTGLGPVGVVVVEVLSPYLDPSSPRPYLVLADAASAVVLGDSREGEGFLATHLANDGARRGSVRLAHPGRTGARELIAFASSNDELTGFATEALRRAVDRVLADAGCALSEVSWVLPHQPNGSMLGRIVADLGVDVERVVPVVREVGSVGAASIAVSLDRLWRSGRVRAGDKLLFAGVGAGMAYGAALYQVGA